MKALRLEMKKVGKEKMLRTAILALLVSSAIIAFCIQKMHFSTRSTGYPVLEQQRLAQETPELSIPAMKGYVPFVEINQDGQKNYGAQVLGGSTLITSRSINYRLSLLTNSSSPSKPEVFSFSLSPKDQNGQTVTMTPQGDTPYRGEVNLFKSSSSSTVSKTTSYQNVKMENIWAGIITTLRALPHNMEQVFTALPGADPNLIQFAVSGVEKMEVSEEGELVLESAGKKVSLSTPLAFQETPEGRTPVTARYRLLGPLAFGFEVGAYLAHLPLVIDPLLSSTYLGGAGEERFAYDEAGGHIYTGHPSVVRASGGQFYVVATTRSLTFPSTAGAYDQVYNDAGATLENDVVIFRFNPTLTDLETATYLGGESEDNGASIALDASGNVYVTGTTYSKDFPTTLTAADRTFNGGLNDVFISRLSPDLSTLQASTYYGGTSTESAYSITISPDNEVYLVGDTSSSTLPTTVGDTTLDGVSDGFVLAMNNNLSAIIASRFLGGSSFDYARAVKITPGAGSLAIVGFTQSANFPVVSGKYDVSYNGGQDGFVVTMPRDLASISAGTFIGHSADDRLYSLAIDSFGGLIVGGTTLSTSYPTTSGAFRSSRTGSTYDVVLSRFNPSLTSLLSSTYYGGSQVEELYEVLVDVNDNIFLLGVTASADLPTYVDAYDRTLAGGTDGFVARFNLGMTTLFNTTYFGGSGQIDIVLSGAFDTGNNLLITGQTDSTNFPTTTGVYSTSSSGLRDLFVSRLTRDLAPDYPSHHLVLTTNANSNSLSMNAGGTISVKVSVRDELNQVVPTYFGDINVVFSGPAVSRYGYAPSCKNRAGLNIGLGSATELSFASGEASTTCVLYKLEQVSMDVEVTGALTSAASTDHDLDLNVHPGGLDPLGTEITVSPSPTIVNSEVGIVVTACDLFGNPVGGAAGANNLVVINISGANPTSLTAEDNGDGTYSTSYTPETAGLDLVRGTLNLANIGSDTEGTRDGTFNLLVNDLGMDHYVIRYEYPPGSGKYVDNATIVAGNTVSVVIMALDVLGNKVQSFHGSSYRTLYFTGASTSPYGSLPQQTIYNSSSGTFTNLGAVTLDFNRGVATTTLRLYAAENAAIDVRDNSGPYNSFADPGYDFQVTVNPTSVNHLKLEGQTTQRAGDVQTVTVTARDVYGNINIYYIYDHQITFSGAINSPGGHVPTTTDDSATPIPFGSAVTLTFNQGVAHSQMRLYARQLAELEVSDGANTSLGSANFDLNVNVLSSGVIDYTTTDLTTDSNPAGDCGFISSKIIARDSYSNQIEFGGSLAMFTVSGVNPHGAAVGRDRGDGSYEYLYPSTNAGEDTITATLDGNPLLQDRDVDYLGAPYTSDGQYHQQIVSGGTTSVRWEGNISSDWFTGDNWSGRVLPQSCYHVIVDGNYTNAPILDHSLGVVEIHSLSLGATRSSVLSTTKATGLQHLKVTSSLNIGNFGSLTHSANSSSAVNRLIVQVLGDLNIAQQGSINVSGKGFAAVQGPGAGISDSYGTGATHAGNGGRSTSNPLSNSGYGSIIAPDTLGSGGGNGYNAGGSGGGSLDLRVGGDLVLEGQIAANGSNGTSAGGGAGGSVLIDVSGELSGNGIITATGGTTTSNSGGGGGGRIALYYDAINGFSSSRITAYGGSGYEKGGAGTIYIGARDLGKTKLILDNNNQVGASTKITGVTASIDDLDLVKGAQAILQGATDFTLLGSTLQTTANSSLTINADSAFHAGSLTNLSYFNLVVNGLLDVVNLATMTGVVLTNNGTLSLPAISSLQNCTSTNNGVYNHSSTTLTVEKGTTWVENGTLPAIGNLVPITDLLIKDGTLEFKNQRVGSAVPFNSLTVKAGGILTHSDNSSSRLYVLNMNINNVNIERNGSVNLVGKGYAQKQGPGAGMDHYSYTLGIGASGGGHGGKGGGYTYDGALQTGGLTYDSLTDPNDAGSGGGCEAGSCSASSLGGGGVIILSSPNPVVIDGNIDASGSNAGSDRWDGAGAGGTVKISTTSLKGSGLILVKGGSGTDGGGGGGRSAIYYDNDDTFNFSNIHAYGGYGDEQYGGAGSVFYKKSSDTYGELIIDNNNRVGAETWLPAGGNFTFKRIVVRNGAQFVNPNTSTLNLLTGQIIESTSNTLFTNKGTLALPSADYTLDMSGGITFRNEGSVTTVTNLTLRNVRFVDVGTFSAGLQSLDIGSGGIMEYANTNPTTAQSVGSIRVRSGGVLTHSENTSSQTYTLNLVVDSMRVDMGGTIDLRARGYKPGMGPGAGVSCNWVGRGCSGGGHASYGGNGVGGTGGVYYGTSVIHPETIGSGGGYETSTSTSSTRGAGGGALKLVADSLLLDGIITASGSNGFSGAADAGGSGGSIWIETSSIKGNGSILANGGNATELDKQGGGSGGRIALYYFTDLDSAYDISAYGGQGYQAGGAGTVYIRRNAQNEGSLTLENNGNVAARTILPNVAEEFEKMFVRNGAIWQIQPDPLYSIGELNVDYLGTAVFNSYAADDYLYVPEVIVTAGGVVTHDPNQNFKAHQVSLWADNLRIDAGGQIDVTGKGYAPGYGATGGLGTGNSGGGYGGAGGSGSSGVPGQSYGSEVSPFDIGSAASGANGGAGGGYVRLQVFNNLTLNGDIIADGQLGGANGGGGAGGSVLASVFHLQGQGFISANGGAGTGTGGGGGGGRIAIFYFTQTLQTDGGRITSLIPGQFSLPLGGAATNSGDEGTLYLAYPHHYEITGASNRTVALPQQIDISFIDNHGNYFIFSGPRTYVISGLADAIDGTHPTCRNMSGQDIALGGATILELSNGLGHCQLTPYREESASVDVNDGYYDSTGNANWDLDVVVQKSGTARGEFSELSASPAIVQSGNPVNVSVTLWEGYGIPISVGGNTVVIRVNGANTATPIVTDNLNGSYSATYTPINTGWDLITATVNGSNVELDTDGVSDGTYHVKVTGGPVHHFEVTGLNAQEAGTSQVITIRAKDQDRVTTTIYDGVHNLILSGALPSRRGAVPTCRDQSGYPVPLGQPTALRFELGEAQCEMKLYRAEAAEIEAEEGLISSKDDPSWDLNVNVIAAQGLSKLSAEIDADNNPVERGYLATAIVNTQDIYGNTAPMNGRTVTLQVAGPNATPLTVIDQGDGSYTASYTPMQTGVDEITGSIDGAAITADTEGMSDGVYHLFVTENVIPTHLEIMGLPSQLAGSSQNITITARDDRGLRSFSYTGDKSITFSGPGIGPEGFVPTCRNKNGTDVPLGTATTLTFTRGQARCILYLYKSESVAVDASDGTLNSFASPSYDLDINVFSGAVDVLDMTLGASPDPGSSGSEETITILTTDNYGNPTNGGHLVVVTVSGANSATPPVRDNLDGSYVAKYTPINLGEDLITATVNGAIVTQDSDGVSDGVYHLDIGESRQATHLKIIGNNSQLAGSNQEITIEAQDEFGQAVWSYNGNHALVFTGPGVSDTGLSPFCVDSSGAERPLGTNTVLTFTRGAATCQLTLYRSELTSLDASDGALSTIDQDSYDLDIQVIAGPVFPGTPTITATPRPTPVRGEVLINVLTFDQFGNKAGSGDYVVIDISGTNSRQLTAEAAGIGTYQASYRPEKSGTDNITAMISGSGVLRDEDGISDGVFELPVLPATQPTHFEIKGQNRQHTGDPQIIRILAMDDTGTVTVDYHGHKTITITGASASADGRIPVCRDKNGRLQVFGKEMDLFFDEGETQCELLLFNIELSELDATDGSISSTGDPLHGLDVHVFGADVMGINGEISATPNPVGLGHTAMITVQALGPTGQKLTAGGSLLVLAVNQVLLSHTQVTDNNDGTYTAEYLPSAVGEDLITGSIDGQTIIYDLDGTSDGVYHLIVEDQGTGIYQIMGTARYRDRGNSPASGVLVTDGARKAYTNSEGKYVLSGVPDGEYTLTGSVSGGLKVEAESGVNPVVVDGESVFDKDLVVYRELPEKVYAPWNGFLGNVVIVELFNTGQTDLYARLSLYNIHGKKAGEMDYRISSGKQRDIIVNDMPGFEVDRYGVLKLELSHARYNGQVSYYKLTPEGQFRLIPAVADDFDYAFANPFVSPISGVSHVAYNTFQPSLLAEEANYLVPNWLTIINGSDSKEKFFLIKKYDQRGQRVNIPDNLGTLVKQCTVTYSTIRCAVGPMGRVDIDGGHVYPGPNNIGTIEVIPEDLTSPYSANLVRYGMDAPPEVYTGRYSFASYLQTRRGSSREQLLPISSTANADNFLELVNVAKSSTKVTLRYYDYTGKEVGQDDYKLGSMQQTHIDATRHIGPNSSGIVRISTSETDSLIANNVFYYRDQYGGTAAVLMNQSEEALNTTVYGTYNTFLDTFNWLKLVNLTDQKRSVTLDVYLASGVDSRSVTLPAYGGVDLPLHDQETFGINVNELGMFAITDSVAGGIFAGVLRIKQAPDGSFDFIIAGKVR